MAGQGLAQSYRVHTYPGELAWITETDNMKLTIEGKELIFLKVMGFNKMGDPRSNSIILNLLFINPDTKAPLLYKKESEVRFLIGAKPMKLRIKSYQSKKGKKSLTEFISLNAEFEHIERLAEAKQVEGYWGSTRFILSDEVLGTLIVLVEAMKRLELQR
jgi:hypothetical protein